MDRKLIGSCGKYCGDCRVRRASLGDVAAADVAAALGVEETAVHCGGCQGPAEERFPKDCKIIPCVVENRYRYCAQCPQINDCSKYAAVNAESGGKARLHSSQLRAWGEERWLRFREKGGKDDAENDE